MLRPPARTSLTASALNSGINCRLFLFVMSTSRRIIALSEVSTKAAETFEFSGARFLRVRWNDLLAVFYASLAADDATWPASAVMNTFKLVISDKFVKSPVSTALRSAAITAAVV